MGLAKAIAGKAQDHLPYGFNRRERNAAGPTAAIKVFAIFLQFFCFAFFVQGLAQLIRLFL